MKMDVVVVVVLVDVDVVAAAVAAAVVFENVILDQVLLVHGGGIEE